MDRSGQQAASQPDVSLSGPVPTDFNSAVFDTAIKEVEEMLWPELWSQFVKTSGLARLLESGDIVVPLAGGR